MPHAGRFRHEGMRPSVEYATIFNAVHKLAGQDKTRHFLANHSEFTGRQVLLGQLVHYRIDPTKRGKFDASTAPGLFAGWRFDYGQIL